MSNYSTFSRPPDYEDTFETKDLSPEHLYRGLAYRAAVHLVPIFEEALDDKLTEEELLVLRVLNDTLTNLYDESAIYQDLTDDMYANRALALDTCNTGTPYYLYTETANYTNQIPEVSISTAIEMHPTAGSFDSRGYLIGAEVKVTSFMPSFGNSPYRVVDSIGISTVLYKMDPLNPAQYITEHHSLNALLVSAELSPDKIREILSENNGATKKLTPQKFTQDTIRGGTDIIFKNVFIPEGDPYTERTTTLRYSNLGVQHIPGFRPMFVIVGRDLFSSENISDREV